MRDKGTDGLLLTALTLSMAGMAVCARHPSLWAGMVGFAAFSTVLLLLLWKYVHISKKYVLLIAVLFRLFVIGMPPGLSDDGYRYVWDGRVQRAGLNPYSYKPNSQKLKNFQEEPIYEKLNSKKYYSVYPPVSQLIFWIGGQFYGLGAGISFYVIKGLFALFEIAALFLLAKMVSARHLMLYAWQPLVVLEAAGQGHTEAACVFFLLATVWGCRKEHPWIAGAALAGAVGAKLFPLLLFPFLWKKTGKQALWSGGITLAAISLPYASLEAVWHVLQSLRLYVRLFEFNAGPYFAIQEVVRFITGFDFGKIIGPCLQVLFLGSLPFLYGWYQRRGIAFSTISRMVIGLFFALATTVHPWYLLVVLALAPFAATPRWHWHLLALSSIGTYLFYIDGPYWPFVVIGWSGWLSLVVWDHREGLVQLALRLRARQKARWIGACLPDAKDLRLLDLGASEGYVGERFSRNGNDVHLADVRDRNRTPLPLQLYDGKTLSFENGAFDTVLLVYVLHHTQSPEVVMREALRVSSKRILILESGCRGRWRRLLHALDRIANGLRGDNVTVVGEAEEPHFRTLAHWRDMAEEMGAQVTAQKVWGMPWHRKILLCLHVP